MNSTYHRFFKSEAFSGLLLILSAVFALIWANSAWGSGYEALKHLPLKLEVGDWRGKVSLEHLINDGLMVLFFVLVGLEIKREVIAGELRQPRQAMLAVFAAIGGMVLPALIFLAFNFGSSGARGWGMAMATDIAFALGMLALLGSRVPLALKVFLTALAIVDDLGAVLVIAVFYTSGINLLMLVLAVGTWLLVVVANFLGVISLAVYATLGVVLWAFTVQSGVHATVAGVLLALAIPLSQEKNLGQSRNKIKIDEALERTDLEQDTDARESRLQDLEESISRSQGPLYQLEHGLQPWVTYLVLPAFAFINAGLNFQASSGPGIAETSNVTLGVFVGLLLGKPLGVFGSSWLAVRFGLAELPKEVTWKALAGVSVLAGIGFTMALFIATLAFGESASLERAKLGILSASVLAAVFGLSFLARVLPPVKNG